MLENSLDQINNCLMSIEKNSIPIDSVNSLETFKQKYPVLTYEDIYDKINKQYESDKGFIKDQVIYWALTSGSIAAPKRIPITKQFIETYHKAFAPVFTEMNKRFSSEIFVKDGFLPLVGKYHFTSSPTGIPVGCISGLIISQAKERLGPFFAYDFDKAEKLDLENRWEYISKSSNNKNIRCIFAANPAYLLELIKLHSTDNKINKANAKNLWPNLKLVVTMTGGACIPYIDSLKTLFPETELWDGGIGGSEGYYARPVFKPEPVGILNTDSYFFEFLREKDDPRKKATLNYEDLEDGENYQLIVTTENGLIRYNTLDIIRKEGDKIRYIGRYDKTYSFVGERLTEIQLRQAFDNISKKLGNRKIDFKFYWDGSRYKFYIFDNYLKKYNLGKIIDNELKSVNINYKYAREMYKVLRSPTVNYIEFEKTSSFDINGINELKLLRQEKPELYINL